MLLTIEQGSADRKANRRTRKNTISSGFRLGIWCKVSLNQKETTRWAEREREGGGPATLKS
jgi:hypothetical protein